MYTYMYVCVCTPDVVLYPEDEHCCFLLLSSIPGKSFAIGQGSSLMSPLGMGNIGVGTGREYSTGNIHTYLLT